MVITSWFSFFQYNTIQCLILISPIHCPKCSMITIYNISHLYTVLSIFHTFSRETLVPSITGLQMHAQFQSKWLHYGPILIPEKLVPTLSSAFHLNYPKIRVELHQSNRQTSDKNSITLHLYGNFLRHFHPNQRVCFYYLSSVAFLGFLPLDHTLYLYKTMDWHAFDQAFNFHVKSFRIPQSIDFVAT